MTTFIGDLSAWKVGRRHLALARAELFNGDLNAWNVTILSIVTRFFNGDLSAWTIAWAQAWAAARTIAWALA